jgi:hypothetical protein
MPSPTDRRWNRFVVPTLAMLAAAAAVSVAVWARPDDAAPSTEPSRELIRSSGASFDSLSAMQQASDTVVIAEAITVGAGRTFAAANGRQITSQIVTLRVGRVLSGSDPGPTLQMEEESRLDGTTPVEVDGLRPTEPGDQGIFFLVAVAPAVDSGGPGTEDGRLYVTVATSGRLLRSSLDAGNDSLQATDDPLAKRLAAAGGNRLTDAILRRIEP